MKATCCVLALSVFAILPVRADASPIAVYDNFGPGQSYDTGDSWAVLSVAGHSGQALAVPFSPASTVTLDAVLLPLNYLSGTNSVVVSLHPDVGGQPGATSLESFTLTGLPTEPTSTVFQLNSVSEPVLDAGTTYWIAAFPGSSETEAGWLWNSTGALGFSGTLDGGNTWVYDDNPDYPAPALEVLGNQVATPEPSVLMMLAGLGVCTVEWRRRRKSVPR
jgi:PEP-CTERM motif